MNTKNVTFCRHKSKKSPLNPYGEISDKKSIENKAIISIINIHNGTIIAHTSSGLDNLKNKGITIKMKRIFYNDYKTEADGFLLHLDAEQRVILADEKSREIISMRQELHETRDAHFCSNDFRHFMKVKKND